MDLSLDDLIKQKKVSLPKRKTGQQQQRRRPQQQQQQARRQPIGDARDRISKLRKQQLIGQDARRRIEQRKRHEIKDARQLLAGKKQQQQQQQQQQPMRRPASSGVGGFVPLANKVVANNLFRARPAPAPQLVYEDSPPPSPPMPRARAHARGGGGGGGIPVQVTRQRRERSRSPLMMTMTTGRRQTHHQAAAAAPPPPPPPPQATIVQAYKVSINNLHPGVTREDIYELFSSVGPVKKCVLVRAGAAEVVYPSKEHAVSAVRRYDRRELDGMAMQLRLSVVGIKVHAAAAAAAASASASTAPAVVDERAVRAALFRGGGGGDGRHGRPVNFQISM